MESLEFPIPAGELGQVLGAEVVGDAAQTVERLSPLTSAAAGALVYFSDKRFLSQLDKIRNVVLLTTADLVRPELPLTFLVVPDPKAAFSSVVRRFHSRPREIEISKLASVHSGAKLAPGVGVGAHAYVGRAEIGEGVSIGAQCFIADGVKVGAGTILYPRVTLLEGVTVGERCVFFPGSVFGSDGFGFVPGENGEAPREVPQVGSVVIEDDVRIGANCTVDRATIGETRIGAGTKIDNMVHVGHNVTIGKRCILCAQVGIAGSANLGDDTMVGGQAGIADHIQIGKGAKVGAASALFTHVKEGETVMLYPAISKEKAIPVIKYLRRLPEMWQRLKALEARFAKEEAE